MSKDIVKQHKKVVFLEKFRTTLGNVTEACENLQISRSTYYKWLKEDADFAQKVNDVMEESIDFAESCLQKKMRQGNTSAIIFYLKTKGKHRGYVESQKIIAEGGLNIDLPPLDLELVGGEDD